MKKNTGLPGKKRDRILQAAALEFSQKGFHRTKMDDIAARACVAKGTLYYNFSSKSKLFSATVTEGIETIVAQIQAQLDADMPFRKRDGKGPGNHQPVIPNPGGRPWPRIGPGTFCRKPLLRGTARR